MKRQLHTRSKNLQSTFIHFVEFQFTEEMLMQVSISRIPDPRSTQAGRPRTGGRRLQSSWLRRLGGPRRRKRRLRRLHGGAASTLLFNITLVLSPPGFEVSCRHFPTNGSWISYFYVFFTVPFSSFSRVILKEAILSILHEMWWKNDTPMSVKPKKVQYELFY